MEPQQSPQHSLVPLGRWLERGRGAREARQVEEDDIESRSEISIDFLANDDAKGLRSRIHSSPERPSSSHSYVPVAPPSSSLVRGGSFASAMSGPSELSESRRKWVMGGVSGVWSWVRTNMQCARRYRGNAMERGESAEGKP
mmetsp:Transcript_10149/g.24587  ORF Transcript_10149/g.24587 Transcript_10149/m.24587 type:complete len:142 (+) Transcript_10149:1-426(+)